MLRQRGRRSWKLPSKSSTQPRPKLMHSIRSWSRSSRYTSQTHICFQWQPECADASWIDWSLFFTCTCWQESDAVALELEELRREQAGYEQQIQAVDEAMASIQEQIDSMACTVSQNKVYIVYIVMASLIVCCFTLRGYASMWNSFFCQSQWNVLWITVLSVLLCRRPYVKPRRNLPNRRRWSCLRTKSWRWSFCPFPLAQESSYMCSYTHLSPDEMDIHFSLYPFKTGCDV